MGFHGHYTSHSLQKYDKDTTYDNYLLIEDAYSKSTWLYGMERITTEEIMEKLDMFQATF